MAGGVFPTLQKCPLILPAVTKIVSDVSGREKSGLCHLKIIKLQIKGIKEANKVNGIQEYWEE